MKIGLYLQDNTVDLETAKDEFYATLKLVKNAKLDLFVFPEHAWTPFDDELEDLAVLSYDDSGHDIDAIRGIIKRIAELAECAVIFSRADKEGAIYSCFVNPYAKKGETIDKFYLKHVATSLSALDLSNYEENLEDLFCPVFLNGFKLGQTICCDSAMPLLSRAYGLSQVDLIINCTGGHVDYKKWSYYQKSRAIENQCSILCTMAYFDNDAKNSSYVFGYDSYGKKSDYSILGNGKNKSINLRNAVYVFDVDLRPKNCDLDLNCFEIDEFISQKENINKNIDLFLQPHELVQKLHTLKKLDKNLFVLSQNEQNIIICYVKENSITHPEFVANLLYNDKLSAIANKRYIIFNDWDFVEPAYYERILSSILRVRAAENFCAVVLNSKNIVKCFQVGKNKNSQIVQMDKNGFGIDLSRTTGPEAIWKNKNLIGMRGEWRNNYKVLLDFINKHANDEID